MSAAEINYYANASDAANATNLIAGNSSAGDGIVGHKDSSGNISSYTSWLMAGDPVSNGTSLSTLTIFQNGTTLNGDGGTAHYYLFPATSVAIIYFDNLTDALAKTNVTAISYTGYAFGSADVGTSPSGNILMEFTSDSTGTSSPLGIYDTIINNHDGVYYAYPSTKHAIYYFANQSDADSAVFDGTGPNPIAISYSSFSIGNVNVGSIAPGKTWVVSTTSAPGGGVTTGDEHVAGYTLPGGFDFDNYYCLYAKPVYVLQYYSTRAGAEAHNGSTAYLGSSTTYVLGNVDTGSISGQPTTWEIAIGSTGVSSKLNTYDVLAGVTFDSSGDGIYYLYSSVSHPIYYYTTYVDITTNQNMTAIAISYTNYTIGDAPDLGTIPSDTTWMMDMTSSRGETSTAIFGVGGAAALNSLFDGVTGSYRMYMVPVIYYANRGNAIAHDGVTGILAYNNGGDYSIAYAVNASGAVSPYTTWEFTSNSIGTSPKLAIYATTQGTSSINNDGTYYAYPGGKNAIYYYDNSGNANTGETTGLLAISYSSYAVGDSDLSGATFHETTSWGIGSTSTGTSSQSGTYANGVSLVATDSLSHAAIYYLYPKDPPPPSAKIYYYATRSNAEGTTSSIAQNSTSYAVGTFDAGGNLSGNTQWEIAVNRTGDSSLLSVYSNGVGILSATLLAGESAPVVYHLYPKETHAVYYFANRADAEAMTSPTSISYTSYEVGQKDVGATISGSWEIATSSMGTSSAAAIYTNETLLNDGAYYLYPSETHAVYYYPSRADAEANTNALAISYTSYAVEDKDVGSFYPYGPGGGWEIAAGSTGTSSKLLVYYTGTSLNGAGVYYMYPFETHAIYYFANRAAAEATTSPTSISYTSYDVGYKDVGATITGSWEIATSSIGSSSKLDIYTTETLTNDGAYYLYPSETHTLYYYANRADAEAQTNLVAINYTSYAVGSPDVGTAPGASNYEITTASTGTSTSRLRIYGNGDLDTNGKYYLYPSFLNAIYYYANQTDADATSATGILAIDYDTYTIGNTNFGSLSLYTKWKLSTSSTGTSSTTAVYTNGGSALNSNGTYYAYPAPAVMYYYDTQAHAETPTLTGFLGIGYTNYAVGSVDASGGAFSSTTSWKLGTNSTGTSSKSATYVNGTDTLDSTDSSSNPAVYFLFPYTAPGVANIKYYDTRAKAIAAGNDEIATNTTSFVVGHTDTGSLGSYTTWEIATSSSGTSSALGTYTTETLSANGIYYMYPGLKSAIYYYTTLADAIDNANAIAVSYDDYDVGASDIGTIGTTNVWEIASNSVGPLSRRVRAAGASSSKLNIYDDTATLISPGPYFLYTGLENAIYYYPTEADALTNTNAIAVSYTGYDIGDHDVGAVPYPTWKASSNSPASLTGIKDIGFSLTASGTYYLYRAYHAVYYYSTEAAALAAGTNTLGVSYTSYVVGAVDAGYAGAYSSWRIASNSTGLSSGLTIYSDGATLDSSSGGADPAVYFMYPSAPCFLEGSTILCAVDGVETWLPVEQIRQGTLVKTSRDGLKPVVLVGKGIMLNLGTDERVQNRMYRCPKENYPELKEDLYLTGCHSILVDKITDVQREKSVKMMARIFVTDKKYRLMACIDERAEPWLAAGNHTIWNFALEHADIYMNYGVYANGGLLVESSSIRFMRDRSNMVFL